jgi:hypothetical protein
MFLWIEAVGLEKVPVTIITKGRRLALPALRFFEAFSRSRRSYVPRPTPLAGTQGRTRRSRSWAESHSWHQRRRHVAQLFPARRAMVGAVRFSPHPIPLHFTSWIDTLDGGARHHGHSELPQRPPTHPAEVSPFGGQRFDERTERTSKFSLRALAASTENHPNRLWSPKKSVEKTLDSRTRRLLLAA